MAFTIDLRNVETKRIDPLGDKFRGTAPDGTELGFTDYYMTKDGAFLGYQQRDPVLSCAGG